MEKSILIAEKTNYLNKDIQYLKNIQISEYDIKSAGFSVIKFQKLLPADEIERLEKMPKFERNVAIGLKMKSNPSIAESIVKTLESVRKAFVYANKINDINILSIKKDAIFVIKQIPEILNIKEHFQFVKKNTYTSYGYLNGKEFYYDSAKDVLDIKGLPADVLEKAKETKNTLKNLFKQSEKIQPESLFPLYQSFSRKYLNRELPLENYRELETGMFRLNGFLLNEIGEDMRDEVDISQNYLKYFLLLIQNVI